MCGGFLPPFHGLGIVDVHTFHLCVAQAKVELCSGVPFLRSLGVPFHGFLVILVESLGTDVVAMA